MPTSTILNIPEIKDSYGSTYLITGAPTSTNLFAGLFIGYNDEQFHTDVKNAEAALDDLERQALEEYEQGKAHKFPV